MLASAALRFGCGLSRKVHGEFATASDIEIASTCIMTTILKGKHVPGLDSPRSQGPPPPTPPPLGGEGTDHPSNDLSPPALGMSRGSRRQGRTRGGGLRLKEGGGSAVADPKLGRGDGKGVGGGVAEAAGVGGGSGCVFEAALEVALRQHRAFPHPVSNLWAVGVMVILHEWMVNRGEFSAAEG